MHRAEDYSADQRGRKCGACEQECFAQAVEYERHGRLVGAPRFTEIAGECIAEEAEVLHGQRIVQTEIGADAGPDLGCGGGIDKSVSRITRKVDDREDNQGHCQEDGPDPDCATDDCRNHVCSQRSNGLPGTVDEINLDRCLVRAAGHKETRGHEPSGEIEGIQRKHNAAALSHHCEKVATPSPIRTLPSVPELHRIVLVARHLLADYTAGRDLIVINRDLTQTPKAVLPLV